MTVKFNESLTDFYILSDLADNNLTVVYYLMKGLKKKKHRPLEIKRLLTYRSHKALHLYVTQLLDKPIQEFNEVKLKAASKMKRDILNHTIVYVDEEDETIEEETIKG